VSDKTLAQIGYEAAAKLTGCEQPWADANQGKWKAAADAVAEECAKALDAEAALSAFGNTYEAAAAQIRALKVTPHE
jgi:hypothetical protein